MGYGVILCAQKITHPGYSIAGWRLLMAAIFFISGAILLAVGIVGEYLRRVLAELLHEKQYSIGEMDF
jgi:hypothetical protein